MAHAWATSSAPGSQRSERAAAPPPGQRRPPTKPALTYQEQIQEHLSEEGTYLMGDAQTQGFPIRYASPGFEKCYGYGASDIVGRKCGQVIGGATIIARSYSLAQLANGIGLSLRETDTRLKFLTRKAAESCRVMMENVGTRVGVSLLVNRKKSGHMFVCECIVLALRHPSLNWCYTLGFQRDISKDISVQMLMDAAHSDAAYNSLLESRSEALAARREVLLGPGSEIVVRTLHEKAMDVFSLDIWRTLRSEMLFSAGGSDSGTHPQAPSSPGPTATPAPSPDRGLQVRPTAPRSLAVRSSSPPAPALGNRKPHPPGTLQRRQPPVPTLSSFGALDSGRNQGNFDICPSNGGGDYAGDAVNGYGNDPLGRFDVQSLEEVLGFLTNIGLKGFADPLLRSGFDDMDTLLELTEEDMRDLGLPRGFCVKLRKALRNYGKRRLMDLQNEENSSVGSAENMSDLEIRLPERRHSYGSRPTPANQHERAHAIADAAAPDDDVCNTARSTAAAPSVEEVNSVQRSWDQIKAFGISKFGQLLFFELFRLEPDCKAFFPPEVCEKYWDWAAESSDLTLRKGDENMPLAPQLYAKVVNLLAGAVLGLHDAANLVPNLVQVGARHVAYGVTVEHLTAMGMALSSALKEVLGANFTDEVERSWSVVFSFITASMSSGMHAAQQLGQQERSNAMDRARLDQARKHTAQSNRRSQTFSTVIGDSTRSSRNSHRESHTPSSSEHSIGGSRCHSSGPARSSATQMSASAHAAAQAKAVTLLESLRENARKRLVDWQNQKDMAVPATQSEPVFPVTGGSPSGMKSWEEIELEVEAASEEV